MRACRQGPSDPRDGLKTVPYSPLRTKGVLTRVGWTVSLFVAASAMVCLAATTASSASLYDPALRFRMFPTEHFVIYFHRGEESLAARLAVIAEDTWRAVQQALRVRPPARTEVVLVDQSELANGLATPLPYDAIVVTAVWPAGADFIGSTEDWLRLVFTHEFTHIVHLDRSEGWARAMRRVFGRIEIAFPNLFLPTWQIEGLATYEESAITGEGRLHAGDFGAVLSDAARGRAFEPLDRVNGGLTDWPNGYAPYAYGLGFHQYLADRYGVDQIARLADATARRLPYTASRAFRSVYGQSLGALWREYEASVSPAPAAAAADAGVARLTHHGFAVSGPRFDRYRCETCPAAIVYAVRTPHGFPALNEVTIDGAAPRQLTTRYLGSTTAIGREILYFDQLDLRRNVGLYSDLYAFSRSSGQVNRLTSEARLLDPDLSPDGETLVAVQDRPGQRNLVLVRLKPDTTGNTVAGSSVVSGFSRTLRIDTLIAEPETQFNAPRWSPDGRRIVVERHRRGSLSEVVVVDPVTAAILAVRSIAGARVVTPTWRPDGRAVVAPVAPPDQPFNLFEFSTDDADTTRQLTHTTGGATWPDVSPDGRTIVFVGYTVEGFDLFTVPYPAASSTAALSSATQMLRPATTGSPPSEPPDRETTAAHDYTPWRTLRPTSWTPIAEGDSTQLRAGAATSGYDVLGYHAYYASATWLVSGPADAQPLNATAPDWNAYYAYDRWRPTVWVAASSATSFFSGPATDAGTPTAATLRERQLEAGILLPIRNVRVSHTALASVLTASDSYTLSSSGFVRHRSAVRGAWATSSAHTYGYSISREGGLTVGTTVESIPRALGSFANATATTADARVYLPGAGDHHVVAVRLAGGVSTGDADVRRTFLLGGASANGSVIDFGRRAISLLRGFGSNTFAGSHVALINADYRFPLARPQRGLGTWPLLLHTVHASIFADAGHAWTRTFRTSAIKTSAGAELSTDVIAGYFFPVTVTVGAAWGHDGSHVVRDRATVYVRIGHAF